jgi:hypothetical protein
MKKLNNKVSAGTQFRHGDVFLVVVDSIPADAKKRTGNVVAEGEITGHAHTLDRPMVEAAAPTPTKRKINTNDYEMYEKDGNLYFRTGKQGASIKHQEHNRIGLPGDTCFKVIIQREWSPEGDQRVRD